MNRTLVIVGSDTEVGKTYVSCGILRALRLRGVPACGIKPIESGVADLSPEVEDGALLAKASGQMGPTQALIRLQTPIAPPAAADLEGVSLDWDALVNQVSSLSVTGGITLVEGAGGMLSPLTWSRTSVDLAQALGATLILVVADRLGAVHHTRTNVAVARANGLDVAGIVLCAGPSGDGTTGNNRRALLQCPEWIGSDGPPIYQVGVHAFKDPKMGYDTFVSEVLL